MTFICWFPDVFDVIILGWFGFSTLAPGLPVVPLSLLYLLSHPDGLCGCT